MKPVTICMQKKWFLLFLLMPFMALSVSAQSGRHAIKGKVIDKDTQLPLQGASVFAQNTTLGTVTNEEGKFRLSLPEGGYSLTVTFSGYETESIRINAGAASEQDLVFELTPQEKALEEVSIVISNEVKDGWVKYGEYFRDNFIGESALAKQCEITNPEVLKFYFYKKKNRLKVIATEPLIINNNGLGYVIKFAIDSFITDYNSNTSQFIGYPLFEEMEGTDQQRKVWDDNRIEVYAGSMLHFMRSLYDQALTENDFQIQYIGTGRKAITYADSALYDGLGYSFHDENHTVSFLPDHEEIAILFKQKPDENFLKKGKGLRKDYQVSNLKIIDRNDSITIEENGFFFDQENIFTNGYLAFRKIGDMLPYDYDPDQVVEEKTIVPIQMEENKVNQSQ